MSTVRSETPPPPEHGGPSIGARRLDVQGTGGHGPVQFHPRWKLAETVTLLARRATGQVLAMLPNGPAEPTRIGCAEALTRGVPVRIIRTADTGRSPALGLEVSSLACAGAQVRTVHQVRCGLLVVDGEAAVLSPAAWNDAGLVIRDGALVEGLSTLFGGAWEAAARCGPPTDTSDNLEHRTHAVLQLLAQGVTDSSAARSLGVSVRTYRRWVAEMMASLGAASRFQAGVYAVERGLLPAA